MQNAFYATASIVIINYNDNSLKDKYDIKKKLAVK
jgi:hypothetical protein